MQPTTSAVVFSEITLSDIHLVPIAVVLLISLPGTVVIGFFAGRAKRRRLRDKGEDVGKVVGETTMNAFLTLLGLLLAFTFGNALTVSQSIKGAITDEAAALGTAFLRADYLEEPGRTRLQEALLEYAKTRVVPRHQPIDTRKKVLAFLETSLRAQAKLWPLTLEATRDPTPAPIKVFVASAMNDALDAHLYRLATLSVPVSAFTQAMTMAAALTAVFLIGNRTGMLGHHLNWRVFTFALFLGVLMYTIVDIRRASEGLVRVDDSALRATIYDMEQTLAARQ